MKKKTCIPLWQLSDNLLTVIIGLLFVQEMFINYISYQKQYRFCQTLSKQDTLRSISYLSEIKFDVKNTFVSDTEASPGITVTTFIAKTNQRLLLWWIRNLKIWIYNVDHSYTHSGYRTLIKYDNIFCLLFICLLVWFFFSSKYYRYILFSSNLIFQEAYV